MTAFVVKPVSKTEFWSLKDKIVTRNEYLSDDDCDGFVGTYQIYKPKDVDKLREKLINNMASLSNSGGDLFYGDVVRMINKRFGVDEFKDLPELKKIYGVL